TLTAWRPKKDQKGGYVPLPDLPERDAGKTKVLTRVSKLEEINQGGEPEYPLIAQDQKFVRYETRMNRALYDKILAGRFYLRENRPGAASRLEFPDQSIVVKAAWRELPDDETVRRHFYHVWAKVVDRQPDGSEILRDRCMGLVGLHIVHKTPKRGHW